MNVYDYDISKPIPQHTEGVNYLIPQIRINNIRVGADGM